MSIDFENISIDEAAAFANRIYQNNTKAFPSEWNMRAIVTKRQFTELVNGQYIQVEREYITIKHSNAVTPKQAYVRTDLHFPPDLSQRII